MDSAFSTPARYVAEIAKRLLSMSRSGGPCLIINPLLCLYPQEMAYVLKTSLSSGNPDTGITILSDRDRLPIAYLFNLEIQPGELFHLSLLSCIDCTLDRTLLSALYRVNTRVAILDDLHSADTWSNGFFHSFESFVVYKWVCEKAIASLNIIRGNIPENTCSEIPFAAIIPYHAGDILFFALAWESGRTPISHAVINAAYEDILKESSSVQRITLNLPSPYQNGSGLSDYDYFERLRDQKLPPMLYCFMRASRDYNRTQHHLIDHLAFALGNPIFQSDSKPSRKLKRELFANSTNCTSKKRILLHFDGGWPLKVYPKPQQISLTKGLLESGHEVTILVGKDEKADTYPGAAKITRFDNLAALRSLILHHSLLVGMDSFPAHYATHVLGTPTICLFANTRPSNSDAAYVTGYKALENHLSCRPCSGRSRCPKDNGVYCHNFVEPDKVLTEVANMMPSTRSSQHQQANLCETA